MASFHCFFDAQNSGFRDLSQLLSVKIDNLIEKLGQMEIVRSSLLARLRRSPDRLVGQRVCRHSLT